MDLIPVPITGLYAALLTIILVVLGAHVGIARAQRGVSILHGDDMDLAARMRRHGNFTEGVPWAVLLLAIIELNGASHTLLHVLGIMLVVARILHPIGLDPVNTNSPLRGLGAGLTILPTVIAAGVAAWQFIGS